MSSIPYDDDQGWDGLDDETMLLPPRRRWIWGKGSAVLLAVAVGAICFYAGVRVEKGQLSSASSGLSSSALASRFAGASGTSAAGLAGAFSRLSTRTRSGFGGGSFGGRGSFGTVSSVDGKTIYVNEIGSGNTVKVRLSGSTKITKSVAVGRSAIRPGDSVAFVGVSGSGGTSTATSVTDSGPRSSSAGGGSSSTGQGSAVSSLFQPGRG